MSRPAAIFDLDDTLIVEEAFAMASLREALSVFPGVDPVASEPVALDAVRSVWRRGADHPACVEMGLASWEGLWSAFDGNHPVLDGLRSWGPGYRVEAWEAVVTALAVDDPGLAPVASARFDEAQRRGHPVIEGMEHTMALVADRFRLGLLTNGPSDLQRLKLDQAGLSARFDAVVVSGEVGVGKPDPAVFTLLLDQLDAVPEDSIMVGDSWERDVVGALGVGMSPYWVSMGRTAPYDDPRVTVIESVRDLDSLLA
jgi:putative hydrolase of the HAD superfamily